MRRIILAVTALAMLAVPALITPIASADVPRCQATVADPSQAVTATFSVFHPRAAFTQWANTWEHDYTVSLVPATGAFTGTGHEYNAQDPTAGSVDETISGTYNAAAKTITFTAHQLSGGQDSYTLTDAPTDALASDLANTGTVTLATTVPVSPYGIVESKVTEPQFNVATTDTSYENHGQFVTAQGGGKVAAQKCVGMPLNSTQGTK